MQRRADIQGLRAIACLWVFASHISLPGFRAYDGIDVFFVVSGFVITSLLGSQYQRSLKIGGHSFKLTTFYFRRFFRIFPTAFFGIVASVLIGFFLYSSIDELLLIRNALWAVFFGANFFSINHGSTYFNSSGFVSPLQHYWTLAVDEQFYIFYPILFLLIIKAHNLKIFKWRITWEKRLIIFVSLISFISFAAWLHDSSTNVARSYFSTQSRAWEIGVGALIALFQFRKKFIGNIRGAGLLQLLGFSTVIFAAYFSKYPELQTLLAVAVVLGTALFLYIDPTLNENKGTRFLQNKYLVLIGDCSYSIYIFHWPAIVFLEKAKPAYLRGVPHKLLTILLVLAFSIIFTMFVEKRFRRIGALGIPNLKKNYLALKSINSRKFFIAFAALLLIILAAITTAPLSSNHIRNFQAQYLIGSAEASANNVQMMPNAEHESYSSLLEARRKEIEKSLSITTIPKNLNPPLSFLQESWKYPNCLNSQIPSCILGNADGTNVLNVMGDSNAMALLPTIIQVFQGWKIVVLIHLGCPLSNFEIIFPGKTQVDNTCKIWRENSILYMKTNVPNLSLLTDGEDPASVGKEGYKVVFQNQTIEKSVMLTSSIRTAALNQTLNSIRDLHRPYIFVETIPKHPSIAECAIQMHLKSNCVGRSSQNLETSSIEKSVTKINKGYFLEIRPWLCASGYCPLIIDHTAVFADAHHISKPFALSNSSLLRAYLQEKNLL